MSCLNPWPQGFKTIDKCMLSEMNMAMNVQNLICILYLPHTIVQFIYSLSASISYFGKWEYEDENETSCT